MPGIVTDLLLLQAVTPTGSVLLYGQVGTGLGTQASSEAAGGEQDCHRAGRRCGGDTDVGCSVATTTTPLGLYELGGHLEWIISGYIVNN